jgi:hypothetical protein
MWLRDTSLAVWESLSHRRFPDLSSLQAPLFWDSVRKYRPLVVQVWLQMDSLVALTLSQSGTFIGDVYRSLVPKATSGVTSNPSSEDATSPEEPSLTSSSTKTSTLSAYASRPSSSTSGPLISPTSKPTTSNREYGWKRGVCELSMCTSRILYMTNRVRQLSVKSLWQWN